jgi:hypothetical protein
MYQVLAHFQGKEDFLSPSEIAGSGGVPTESKQGGESLPPQAGGRGRHPPPANHERVTAKALKRGDKKSSEAHLIQV